MFTNITAGKLPSDENVVISAVIHLSILFIQKNECMEGCAHQRLQLNTSKEPYSITRDNFDASKVPK